MYQNWNSFMDFMYTLIVILIIICLVTLLVGLTLYILRAIGVYTLAIKRGMNNPWLAWIPYANGFTLGALADDINRVEGKTTYYRFILLGSKIAYLVLGWGIRFASWMPSSYYSYYSSYSYDFYEELLGSMLMSSGVFWLASLAVFVLQLIVCYKIFQCYAPKSSVVFTVLSVFFSFLQSIFLFAVRTREPNWINPPPAYGSGYPQDINYGGSWPDQQQPAPGAFGIPAPPAQEPPQAFQPPQQRDDAYRQPAPPQAFAPPPSNPPVAQEAEPPRPQEPARPPQPAETPPSGGDGNISQRFDLSQDFTLSQDFPSFTPPEQDGEE